jgi:Ca2+-binding RTX toxin-like protein
MTTFTVTTNSDSGIGSLREALANAQDNGAGLDTIIFDASLAGQVIDLTSGALAISSGAVSINGDTNGDGDADITIERSEANVATSILMETQAATTVNLDSLILRNADTGPITSQAGLINRGTLVITNSVITGQSTTGTNAARHGVSGPGDPGGNAVSGIANFGILTLRETVLENMGAQGGTGGYNYYDRGGTGGTSTTGILNSVGATLNVDNLLLHNVTAFGGRGGDGFIGGNGGNSFGGWNNSGNPVSGDAGTRNLTAQGGAFGVYANLPLISFGFPGAGISPATSGGFTLSPAASMAQSTSGADTITGTIGADIFFGLTGSDTISGDTGNDQLFGGSGNDTLNGGGDNDTLNGWTGDDTLNGDTGNDTLNGQTGNDTLNGGNGMDTLNGGVGNDGLDGGADNDKLTGLDGDDTLKGGTGLDTLYGQNGIDLLNGGDGADTLYGGNDNDTLNGDAGNDILSGDAGIDTLSGGTGLDSLLGGTGNDILNGGDDADRLSGGADNDTLNGDAGNDTLLGDAGIDTLAGGADNDLLYGGAGADSLDGGTGNDRLTGGADADQFRFIGNGFGHDSISDFTAGIDTLVFDAGIFQDTHPTVSTAQQVLDTFGHMNAAGTLYTLNFGGGDVIDIKVTAGLSAATLVDDITIFT